MKKQIYERPLITKIYVGTQGNYGMQNQLQVIDNIDGVPVKDLIKKYGSPVFVVSEQTTRKTLNEAKRAFTTRYPKVQFAWSYKTNYLDAICQIYHSEGSWAEVVSGFEYDKAINNGVPGNKIIFNGPDKSVEDLTKAIANESYIHIDHFDELYTLLELADKVPKKPKVAIRVNMDTGIFPKWARFGFNYENGEAWSALNRIMLSEKLELVGLHAHIGTYIMVASAYGMAASKLCELAVSLDKKFNHKVEYIDVGGGFASKNTLKGAYLPGTDTCPTFDQFAEAITTAIINSEIDHDHLPTLFLETGRALVDDAGYLLGSVIANKRLPDGKRSMIIDIGINMLYTSFWYAHDIVPAQKASFQTEETIIYGPLCMNIDIIRESINFPLLKKGDNVVIYRVGAYSMTQWMQFITLRPKILLIDTDNNVHVIRQNETNETLTDLENVPNHIKTKL